MCPSQAYSQPTSPRPDLVPAAVYAGVSWQSNAEPEEIDGAGNAASLKQGVIIVGDVLKLSQKDGGGSGQSGKARGVTSAAP